MSPSTVSRVLNNYPYVDDETRLIVHEVAEALSYPLQNLRRAPLRPRAVTLLTRDTEQGKSDSLANFDQRAARGAQSILEDLDIVTYLRHMRMNPEEVDRMLDETGSDGWILLGGITNRTFVEQLRSRDLPFVIAGAHLYPLVVNCVMADIRHGVEEAVAHLAGRGRRRIGLVNGPSSTNTSREKLNSLRLALQLNDLEFVPARVIAGEFEAEAGYGLTLQLVEQAPDLDAIIYADDHMAMGGLRALKQQGCRVPDDVAVVGFHGFELNQFTDPPITSIEFDMEAMGRIAARRLMMMLDEPDGENWMTLVPTSLVIREST